MKASADGWKAGVSRVKITPSQPTPMAGYISRGTRPAEGTLTDLWCKVLVLEDTQGHRAALVTLDLVGIDRQLSQKICQQVQEQQHWDRSQIAICCSHTHTGPAVGKNLALMSYLQCDAAGRKVLDDYAEFLKTSIVEAVQRGVENLKPATLAWGSGEATFAVNRRANPAPEVPQRRAEGKLQGPSDYAVPVLAVRQGDQLAALVFGYACHCTTLASMEWSGDYAGFAQIDLERDFPGCQAMFWAGCGADQNPLPRQTVELAKEYGKQLATAVTKVMQSPMTPLPAELKTSYVEIALPLATLPTREQLLTDAMSMNAVIALRAKTLLEQIDRGEPLSPTYPYPVAMWKLGKQIDFVILGGEVVVDYAIRLKDELSGERSSPEQVWCAGYANDMMAYIPSRRVLLEGGYEGGGAMLYYGLPTVWAPEVEEMIVDAVKGQAKRTE